MTVTITATPQPGNVPPRVRLDVATDDPDGVTGSILRTNPDGSQAAVRTPHGVGGTATLLYDYEAPFGLPVTYVSEEDSGSQTGDVVLDGDRIWLVPPGLPDLAVSVDLLAGSFDLVENDAPGEVLDPLGSELGVPMSDGALRSDRSEFLVNTETLEEHAALMGMLRAARTLWLNVPPQFRLGVSSAFIYVSGVSTRRRSDIGQDEARRTALQYRVVRLPVGGVVSQRSYADVLLEHADYASVASLPSYAALLAGPDS